MIFLHTYHIGSCTYTHIHYIRVSHISGIHITHTHTLHTFILHIYRIRIVPNIRRWLANDEKASRGLSRKGLQTHSDSWKRGMQLLTQQQGVRSRNPYARSMARICTRTMYTCTRAHEAMLYQYGHTHTQSYGIKRTDTYYIHIFIQLPAYTGIHARSHTHKLTDTHARASAHVREDTLFIHLANLRAMRGCKRLAQQRVDASA